MHLLARTFPKLFGYAPELPTHQEALQLTESCSRSPDLGELEQFEFILLFTPDRAQRGCSEYPMIEDSVYLGYGYTMENFNYWLQRDGLPIPLLTTDTARSQWLPPPIKIKGEIHAIRPYQIRELDNFRDNLVSFRRERLTIQVPQRPVYRLPERYFNGKPLPFQQANQLAVGREVVHRLDVFMYIGVHDYWDELLDGGYNFKPVDHYKDDRPWLQEYYSLKRETYF